jgi:transcription-repair coupling factor (superfamily II helicase)
MNSSNDILRLKLPEPEHPRVQWGQLYGAAQSLAVAQAARHYSGLVCVVTDSAAGADRLETELRFFASSLEINRFSDYETLPYDAFSPPQELIAERLATLSALAQDCAGTLVVNAQALLTRLPPPGFIGARSMSIRVGERLDRQSLCEKLVSHGYLNVEKVVDPGEFAVRGSLLDIFATGADSPVRIDLFDDEIESLRIFDPGTQLTTGETKHVNILPAREFPFDSDAIRGFRERFREHLPGEPSRSNIYRDSSDAHLPAGIEYFLPLFFDSTSSLLDHLPEGTLFVFMEEALAGLDSGWTLIEERYSQLSGDLERPLLPPEVAFWSPDSLQTELGRLHSVQLCSRELPLDGDAAVVNAGTGHPLSSAQSSEQEPIARWLDDSDTNRTLVVTSSPGRREVLSDMLRGRGLAPVEVSGWQEFVSGEQPLSRHRPAAAKNAS